MYNGIGLQTARGSGTNGYVQRNLSFVKQIKKPIEYKSEDDFKRLERELNRVPNKEILEHQNKRQIELKCLELEDQMEEQGFGSEDIEVKVKEFRESLIDKMKSSEPKKTEWLLENLPQNVKETHQMAEANHQKNDQIKTALKISPYFTAGSSLDATQRAKEAKAAEQALQQKKYQLVSEPTEPQIKFPTNDSKDHKKKESKKRNSRKMSSDSGSDSDKSGSSEDSLKKSKKSKSRNKRTKDSKKHKTKARKSRKSGKHSSSGSDSGSDSDSGSSNSSSSDSHSDSSESSDSSHHKLRNNHKNERSRRERRKRSPSPIERNRSKPSHLKESTHNFDDTNNNSIAVNIRQMRKEAQNSLAVDRQQIIPNEDRSNDLKKKPKQLSPKSKESPIRNRYSRSRSSSRSSESVTPVKRLKSAVYETSALKKLREVPKSYDDKRYDSKKDRSLSPNDRSRHSSGHRSRSRSVHSYDSKSSDRSSRSRSHSSSKSSSNSSKSSLRSKTRSRSPSIPRRKGSPSFLDKRRITRY